MNRLPILLLLTFLTLLSCTVSVGAAESSPDAVPTVFVDRTAEFAPDLGGTNWASWTDVNGDGFPDLMTEKGLWRNDAGRRLIHTETALGGGVFGDFDNDGRADFFSCQQRKLFHQQPDGTFADASHLLPELPMTSCLAANWADHDNDGDLDLYVGGYEGEYPSPYQPDVILRNDGDAGFTIAWQQAGDIDPARGATTADYDNDGDLDLYISNYRLEANLLLENDGHGNFTNVAHERGVAGVDDGYAHSFGHTIGSAWGDLDNDGHIDLFVGNFSHPHPHQDRPKFYKNLGPAPGTDQHYAFEDQSETAKLAWQESFASPSLIDLDNDGDLDLYYTTVYKGDHCVLYRNDGDWRFTDITEEAGLVGLGRTYQASWADVDGDGDLDLVTAGKLFINQGNNNHWLGVTLIGDGQNINRDAVGAQVRVQLADRVLLRQITAGSAQTNQSDPTVHLGLGDHAAPITLEVTWSNGQRQVLENVTPGQTLTVRYR